MQPFLKTPFYPLVGPNVFWIMWPYYTPSVTRSLFWIKLGRMSRSPILNKKTFQGGTHLLQSPSFTYDRLSNCHHSALGQAWSSRPPLPQRCRWQQWQTDVRSRRPGLRSKMAWVCSGGTAVMWHTSSEWWAITIRIKRQKFWHRVFLLKL